MLQTNANSYFLVIADALDLGRLISVQVRTTMRRIDGFAVCEGSVKVQSDDERCINKFYSEKEQKKKVEENHQVASDNLPTTTEKLATGPRSLESLQYPTEKLEIDLNLEDELMVKVNPRMVVDGYKRMGVCEAKLHIGDKILMLNGETLEGIFIKHGGHVRLTVLRAMFTTSAHPFRLNKHGYTPSLIASEYPYDKFLVAHINYRPSVHLGISVNSHEGIVVISRVEPGSLTARKFEVSDIVIDVNGESVHDKNEFRNVFMEAMDRNSYASILFQRPYSPKSILASKIALGEPLQEDRDPPLPHDAMMIGRLAAQRFRAHEENSKNIKSVLHVTPIRCACSPQFHNSASEFKIQSDIPEGKKLASVPPRQQISARLRNRRLQKKDTANPLSSSINLKSADTAAPLLNTPPMGVPNPKPNVADDSSQYQKRSILQWMTNSFHVKKNKLIGKKSAPLSSPETSVSVSDKKKVADSATDSSSLKQNKNNHHQSSAHASQLKPSDGASYSDRRNLVEKDRNERKKPSDKQCRHADQRSQKQRKSNNYAEKKHKRKR